MYSLLHLIQKEIELLQLYEETVGFDHSSNKNAEPIFTVVNKLITQSVDRINALKYLFDQTSKIKTESEITIQAKEVYAEFRDRNKLIK